MQSAQVREKGTDGRTAFIRLLIPFRVAGHVLRLLLLLLAALLLEHLLENVEGERCCREEEGQEDEEEEREACHGLRWRVDVSAPVVGGALSVGSSDGTAWMWQCSRSFAGRLKSVCRTRRLLFFIPVVRRLEMTTSTSLD